MAVELIGLFFGVVATIAAIRSLFARTDRTLVEIRNVLIEIRDRTPKRH